MTETASTSAVATGLIAWARIELHSKNIALLPPLAAFTNLRWNPCVTCVGLYEVGR